MMSCDAVSPCYRIVTEPCKISVHVERRFLRLVVRKEEIAYSTQRVYNGSQVRKQKGANTPWKDS